MNPFKDNSRNALPNSLTDQQYSALVRYGNQALGDLVKSKDNQNLLVFPHCLGDNLDDINKLPIYTLSGNCLQTGNVVGFCGMDGIDVHIHSRFDSDDNQYFLHYMLQKVFGINILNLPTRTKEESIWDFLLYLFPYALKKAMQQGLFRCYQTFHFNDAKVKGTINIPAHILRNIPFTGRIAYQTREHTANNHVIHLIRHTIEVIKHHPYAKGVLTCDQETRQGVETIIAATPDYSSRDFIKIIARNLRPMRHPFYTEYSILQKLCLKILRHECLTYGEEQQKIHGILFDAAWLWEEYLSSLLQPHGFIHPRNKNRTGALDFYDGTNGSYKGAIPDFYKEKPISIVIDAKYKPLENRLNSNDLREDRFQLISYMHIQKADIGVLIYPTSSIKVESMKDEPQWEGTLRGYGGKLGIFGLTIPGNTVNFHSYIQQMEGNAAKVVKWLCEYMKK